MRARLPAILGFGVLYFAVGHGFGAMAATATSSQERIAWRLAAWVISALAFAAHIGYGHRRVRGGAGTTALDASLAVALGAFGLAVAAFIHGATVHHHFPIFALAAWPVMTAIPAFLVALVVAALLARFAPRQ